MNKILFVFFILTSLTFASDNRLHLIHADKTTGRLIDGEKVSSANKKQASFRIRQKGADGSISLLTDATIVVGSSSIFTDPAGQASINVDTGMHTLTIRKQGYFPTETEFMLVNDTLIAHGEVVVVNEKFGIRLTDVLSAAERIQKLGEE